MEGTSTVISALGTACSSISSDMVTAISTVLPYAATAIGAILVVTFGIKAFRRFAK